MSAPTASGAATTGDLPTLDVEVLGGLGLLDEGMGPSLADLIDAFTSVTDAHLRELHDSVDTGDIPGVRRLAHTVKGSGGQLGGRALAGACTRLEEWCETGPLASGVAAVHEVEVAYRALQRDLHALVAPDTT